MMQQGRVWLFFFLLLIFRGDQFVVGQNFDHQVSVVSYASSVIQSGGGQEYQQQSLGAAAAQWVQDHVRIKTPASHFNSVHLNNSRLNNFSQAPYGQLAIEQTYPYLSEHEFRILFSREIELGLKTREQVLKLYHLYNTPNL